MCDLQDFYRHVIQEKLRNMVGKFYGWLDIIEDRYGFAKGVEEPELWVVGTENDRLKV